MSSFVKECAERPRNLATWQTIWDSRTHQPILHFNDVAHSKSSLSARCITNKRS